MSWIEILKVVFLGIVEGITEWLPVSSTGHMLLVDEFIHMDMDQAFMSMFFVVIQLGAILAVVWLFWSKIWPFHLKRKVVTPFYKPKNGQHLSGVKKFCNDYVYVDKIILWLKILLASLPAAVIGFCFDDQIDAMLTGNMRAYVVAVALIVYGFLFIIIESIRKNERFADMKKLPYQTAFLIGLIQCLALIPGTSRSGSTILGAVLLGTSRLVATEFSFFLSIPAMVGGSGVKLLSYFADGNTFSGYELTVLLLGTAVAFIISVLAIKFLMSYIKKHDFKVFGWYRIILGILILLYFAIVR